MKNKPSRKNFNFKIGDKTDNVWAGDFVIQCEFLGHLGQGRMLFYDKTFKTFRRVFIEIDEDDGTPILNGWDCASCPSKLL